MTNQHDPSCLTLTFQHSHDCCDRIHGFWREVVECSHAHLTVRTISLPVGVPGTEDADSQQVINRHNLPKPGPHVFGYRDGLDALGDYLRERVLIAGSRSG